MKARPGRRRLHIPLTVKQPTVEEARAQAAKARAAYARNDLDLSSSDWFANKMSKEPRFAQFFLSSNTGMALLDDQMRFRAVNSRLAVINGASVESHLGKPLRDVLGEIAVQVEPVFRQIMTTGLPIANFEFGGVLPSKPGTQRWLDNFFPMKNANGQVQGIGAVVVELSPETQLKTTGAISEPDFWPGSANGMLRSWKDISSYVGACVKTVQRWEQHYNFPIRRLERSKGAVVFALKAEVDSWILTRSHRLRAS